MKKNSKTVSLWGMMLATVLLALSSCSSDSNRLLETVPMDAEFVATFNAVELAGQLDITVNDGTLTLPPALSIIKQNVSADDLKTIGQIAEAIDLENIVMFGYFKNEDIFITFAPRDLGKMRSILAGAEFENTTDGGLEIWSKGSNCLVYDSDNDQVWILDNKRDIDHIDDFRRAKSSDNNILRYSGLADALMADNIANAVADQAALDANLGNYWMTASFNIDNNAIVAEAKAITTDGKAFETDALQPVSTDFLRYIPSNFLGAMAFGINPNSDWVDQAQNSIDQMRNSQMSSTFKEVKPYLKALDGTVALGVGPKNKAGLFTPDSFQQWQALFMAHLKQDKVNELTQLLRSQLPGSTDAGNGLYRFTSQEFELVYGSVDGYFAAAAGMDLKPDQSNSFANDFNGKPFALVLQTPLLSSIVDDNSMSYSIKATMEMNGPALRIQLNLVGSDGKIIPTLFKDMPRFAQLYSVKMRQASGRN